MAGSLGDTTVFVTGGAGYIGSHTCVQLLEAGASVVVFDNLVNSSPVAVDRIAELAGVEVGGPRLTFVEGDLCDPGVVDAAIDAHEIDAVVHFAGLKAVGESVEKPLDYYDNNIRGTLDLLRAMDRNGIRRMVFSSSATVYGEQTEMPIDESASIGAISPYGRTKQFIEEILRDVAASGDGWHIALLRYFNPVGAHPSGRIGEDPQGIPNNLMPFVMQVAVGRRDELAIFGDDYPTPDGTCIRDYIHVVDLADAHLAAIAAAPDLDGAVAINVGTGRGSSVKEVVAAAGRAVGREIPHRIVGRRAGDSAVSYADVSLSGELLDWRARFDLDDMVADHWRWQEQNPWGYADGPSDAAPADGSPS